MKDVAWLECPQLSMQAEMSRRVRTLVVPDCLTADQLNLEQRDL
jgi:hypothetical protein